MALVIGVRLMLQASELRLPEVLICDLVFNVCDLGSGVVNPDMSRALVIGLPVCRARFAEWQNEEYLK